MPPAHSVAVDVEAAMRAGGKRYAHCHIDRPAGRRLPVDRKLQGQVALRLQRIVGDVTPWGAGPVETIDQSGG
jgi:hypothetical protein